MPKLETEDHELVAFLEERNICWHEWRMESLDSPEVFRYPDGAGLRVALAEFRGESVTSPTTLRLANPKIVTLAELCGTLFADRSAA